ncbi:MAG: DUF192 domain-containing protein [Patescibacteria group bacterium]
MAKFELKQNTLISNKNWLWVLAGLLISAAVFTTFIIFRANEVTNQAKKQVALECDQYSDNYLGLDVVELAVTLKEQEKGLMFRDELCLDQSMLFVYSQSQYLSFWMKNTYVSLDIIFIDDQGVIDSIYEDTIPKRLLPSYNSTKPVKYVLEASAGFSERNNLKVGDKIEIDKLLEVSVEYVHSK